MPDPTPARSVQSNQSDLHPRLIEVVQRHFNSQYRRPIAPHNQAAFDLIAERVAAHKGPLILDSFCGVGASTLALAQQHPQALVVGIDKSEHRLQRARYHGEDRGNALMVRAEVEDFWRLALAAGWQPLAHYLLYPNPWPKSEHLQRRVHGSPLLPTLLQLGGTLELRSNWQLYLREFTAAVTLAGWQSRLDILPEQPALTPFERKYRDAGQTLWQSRCCAPNAAL